MKSPKLDKIDHVHVYVKDRAKAVSWYEDVLGLSPIESLLFWAQGGGPLTIGNDDDSIHVAVFERETFTPSTATAFGCSGASFLDWQKSLRAKNIDIRVSDHDKAFSLYFKDPDENQFEITTYDHDFVRGSGQV